MNKKEIKVLISLIDMFQFDGAEYTLEGIGLSKLKEKLNLELYGHKEVQRKTA